VWVKKIPPKVLRVLWQFFQNGWEFFDQILHAYYAFLSTLEHEFLLLSKTMTKLCYIKRDHPVHIMCAKCPPSADTHAGIFWHFPQTGIFSPNFRCLLNVHVYARIHIFIELSPTMTKLCHITLRATTKRAFRTMVDILSTLWWSRLIRHYFVKVAGNWIKICSPA